MIVPIRDMQQCAIVALHAAIVGRREDGNQVAARKVFVAFHHALVRAHDDVNVVGGAKLEHAIGAKHY